MTDYPEFAGAPGSSEIDVASADAILTREFRNMVSAYPADPINEKVNLEMIKNHLIIWKENHKKLVQIILQSPILLKIGPMPKKPIAQTSLMIIPSIENLFNYLK